jgi:hypothetical protein
LAYQLPVYDVSHSKELFKMTRKKELREKKKFRLVYHGLVAAI